MRFADLGERSSIAQTPDEGCQMMHPSAERHGDGVVMPHAAVTTFRTAGVAHTVDVPFEALVAAHQKRNGAFFGEGDG